MTARSIALGIAIASTLVPIGCANPYGNSLTTQVAGEQPAPDFRHPSQHPATLPNPESVARRAAALTGTWTGPTVADRYNRLAAISVGEARADARAAAARLPTDRQLTAPGAESTSTIQAIIDRGRRHPDGHTRRLLIVTRERLTTDGRTTSRYRVTLATVSRYGSGWALRRWDPEP